MIVRLRSDKDKELKKMKERMEDERRRESEKFQFDYEKVKGELTLLNRKLGQEEHFNKELAVLNNKMQTNLDGIRYGSDTFNREGGEH